MSWKISGHKISKLYTAVSFRVETSDPSWSKYKMVEKDEDRYDQVIVGDTNLI